MKNEVIGTGSIGTIYKALQSNGDLIAVKPISFPTWNFVSEKISYLSAKIKKI